MVIADEQIFAFEERFDAITGRDRDIALDGAPFVDVHRLGVHRLAVDVDAQVLRCRAAARVAGRDVSDEVAALRRDGEAGDGPVRRRLTDLLVARPRRDQASFDIGQATVGQEHETDRRVGRLQAGGQRERVGEVGTAGRWFDPSDDVVERSAIGRRGEQHLWLRSGDDQACKPAGGKILSQRASLGDGGIEARRFAVRRRHRARRVDDEHGVLGEASRREANGACCGAGEQRHGQQLGEQQPAEAQLLPRARR